MGFVLMCEALFRFCEYVVLQFMPKGSSALPGIAADEQLRCEVHAPKSVSVDKQVCCKHTHMQKFTNALSLFLSLSFSLSHTHQRLRVLCKSTPYLTVECVRAVEGSVGDC